MRIERGALPLATLACVAVLVAGCSSARTSQRVQAAPEQLTPVQSSTVASTALPPIGQPQNAGGTTNIPQTAVNPALTGQPGTFNSNTGDPALAGTPGRPVQTASNDGSFVTLDSVGSVPTAAGRDLSAGLTVEKLLGGWTVVSGPTQCRLNLTQTAKTGTQRYRASTPGCQLQQLGNVASWQLAGSQIQLFDEGGTMIAALILSGNRFIGTLAGGQGISMVG